MMSRDQNGNMVTRSVRREDDGWTVTVWFGGHPAPHSVATNVRRYVYRTREQARDGDIGDPIGVRGRIG